MCFSVMVSLEEVARDKPWPDVYLASAVGLKFDLVLCVAVADSANGFRSVVALVGAARRQIGRR